MYIDNYVFDSRRDRESRLPQFAFLISSRAVGRRPVVVATPVVRTQTQLTQHCIVNTK